LQIAESGLGSSQTGGTQMTKPAETPQQALQRLVEEKPETENTQPTRIEAPPKDYWADIQGHLMAEDGTTRPRGKRQHRGDSFRKPLRYRRGPA
jgi:hypothetical protein